MNFASSSFCWMRFPLYLLLCTAFQLNAAVFADLALYLAVCGLCLGLVELSCSRSLSLSQARLLLARDSATSYLATARLSSRSLLHCIRRLRCGLLEVGLRYALDTLLRVIIGAICAHPLHLWSHCSFLRDLDLSLKLFSTSHRREVSRVSAFKMRHFSCRTRDANFGLYSH